MFRELGYDLFCEIVSENTVLSGAGRYDEREIISEFTKKFNGVPSVVLLQEWEKQYAEELEHNKKRLNEPITWSHPYYRSVVSHFEYCEALHQFS